MIQVKPFKETVVVGGEDCNDSMRNSILEYIQILSCPRAFADYDGDGYPDRDWAFCMSDADFLEAMEDLTALRLQGTLWGISWLDDLVGVFNRHVEM